MSLSQVYSHQQGHPINTCQRLFSQMHPSHSRTLSHDPQTQSYESRQRSFEVRWAMVAVFMLEQVLLMLFFRIIPLGCAHNFGGDGLALIPLCAHLLLDLLSNFELLIGFSENGGTVLRARVGALSVQGGGIMHLEKVLD